MKFDYESIASIKRQIRNYTSDSGAQCSKISQIKITTARELNDNEYQNIVSNLSEKVGGELFVEKYVDPNIIGGIIIQYGDNIIDGSVVRQFKQYKDMMSSIDVKKIGVKDAI